MGVVFGRGEIISWNGGNSKFAIRFEYLSIYEQFPESGVESELTVNEFD